MSPNKQDEPAFMRSFVEEHLSDSQVDDLESDGTIDQDAVLRKTELSEGLTEFLLRKVIQHRARLQPEITLPEQGEYEAHRSPVGSGIEAA